MSASQKADELYTVPLSPFCAMSGHEQVQQNNRAVVRLFDHLVGGREQSWWHNEAKHPSDLGVDD
jgi:hypothetical protein